MKTRLILTLIALLALAVVWFTLAHDPAPQIAETAPPSPPSSVEERQQPRPMPRQVVPKPIAEFDSAVARVSTEAPDETDAPDSDSAMTIDGEALSPDEEELLDRMRGFLQAAELSERFPSDMRRMAWDSLCKRFDEMLDQRQSMARRRYSIHIDEVKRRFAAGSFRTVQNTPRNLPEGAHPTWRSRTDPLTGHNVYDVVVVLPGELLESDRIGVQIQQLDQDIALAIRSFVDRLL